MYTKSALSYNLIYLYNLTPWIDLMRAYWVHFWFSLYSRQPDGILSGKSGNRIARAISKRYFPTLWRHGLSLLATRNDVELITSLPKVHSLGRKGKWVGKSRKKRKKPKKALFDKTANFGRFLILATFLANFSHQSIAKSLINQLAVR